MNYQAQLITPATPRESVPNYGFAWQTAYEMMIGFIGYTKDNQPVKPAAVVSGGQANRARN